MLDFLSKKRYTIVDKQNFNLKKRGITMKSKLLSVIAVMLLIVLGMTISTSAVSFTATMTPSATNVKEATEFTIIVKVSNLDVGANGINSLEGYLKYDTDVFETISESSIEGLNNWSAKFDEATGKISLTKNTFVTSTQEVFQVTFKTKSAVSGKSGTISYLDIVAANSETNISATDISTSITVGNGGNSNSNSNSTSNTSNTLNISTISPTNTSRNTNTNTSRNTNTNTSRNTNTNTNRNTNTNTNKNAITVNSSNNAVSSYVNTTSEEDMPKTGVNDTILLLIFGVIAVAMVFYIKFEKLNKDL